VHPRVCASVSNVVRTYPPARTTYRRQTHVERVIGHRYPLQHRPARKTGVVQVLDELVDAALTDQMKSSPRAVGTRSTIP
jgi:hypothetical protein